MRRLTVGELSFLAVLGSPIPLRVYEMNGDDVKQQIFEYEARDYSPLTGPAYFSTTDANVVGVHGFALKYCQGHACPMRSGAVFYDVADRMLFSLEYREQTGIILSQNMARPENEKTKVWLLSWWQEWPGNGMDLVKVPIRYAPQSRH